MVLLLTGAIDIGSFNVPSTTIIDVNERLSQYISSIDYAITNYKSISEIVFCENTDYHFDYSTLEEKALLNGKKLEVISFKGDYASIQRLGKGFGEGEIIKKALNTSELMQNCCVFFKLTGRLVVKNMDRIVAATQSENSFIYYPKTIYKIPEDHIETYFYKVNKNLYLSHLTNVHQNIDESRFRYLEHLFYEQLSSLDLQSFKFTPLISGYSGTSGNSYEPGKKDMFLEKINYLIGVHNLKKTDSQRIMTGILSFLLKITRLI